MVMGIIITNPRCYHGLREGDALAPHYRGMLQAACARGGDLARLLAGLDGRVTSYSRGRYRSDVCSPIELGIIGLYSGALGPTLEYAAGAALDDHQTHIEPETSPLRIPRRSSCG